MYFFTLHLSRGKVTAAVALVLCIICIFLFIVNSKALDVATSQDVSLTVKNYRDMQNYFLSYGWEVERLPLAVETITIPNEFNAAYQTYETLQEQAGLSLSDYKGKRVKRYTFRITNHAFSDRIEVRGNLLVYKKQIIGGDVSSVTANGFMHALNGNTENVIKELPIIE